MNQHDDLFLTKQKVGDFRFGKSVVSVFDDMVTRSVPFYLEMQRMITEIAQDFASPGTNVYDLGCSTGTTLINLDEVIPDDVNFVGIDESKEMLMQCEANFAHKNIKRRYELKHADLNSGIMLENPSVVIMCLTLQFVRPLFRERLVKEI